MVRRESGFGSRCCGLRHGELPVVRLQFRCRGGAREEQLYGQRAAMITFRSFFSQRYGCPKPSIDCCSACSAKLWTSSEANSLFFLDGSAAGGAILVKPAF